MTTLIFIRHGQSESNLNRVFTGQTDIPLTSLGRDQAERTAQYLKQFPISHIYASDLSRAMDTAAPTARELGLEVVPNSKLREIYAGKWEGKSYDELKEIYGTHYQMWIEDLGRANPDEGERVLDLYQRVNEEIQRLVQLHRGECIAVFSHATPARALACKWFGYAPEDMGKVPWANNASVSVAEYDDNGSVRIVQYGYDGHQGESASSFPKGIV
jgi:broad specificity phosphatase PhoE